MKLTSAQRRVLETALVMATLVGCGPRDNSMSNATATAQAAESGDREALAEEEVGGDDIASERDSAVKRRLRELAPGLPQDQVKHLAETYGWMAVNMVKEHGPAVADAMSWLGAEGAALAREYPDTFKAVAKHFDGKTTVAFLLAVKPHLKELGKYGGLPGMVERIEAMPPEAKSLAQKYPAAIPYLVIAPEEVSAALKQSPEICLRVFPPVDLSVGAHGEEGGIGIADVAEMVVDLRGNRLQRWVDASGLEGLLLANRFPEYFVDDLPMSLDVFLGILSSNQDDIRQMLDAGKRRDVDWALRTVVEQDYLLPRNLSANLRETQPTAGMWYNLAQHDRRTIRFLATFRQEGIRAVNSSWRFYLTYAVGTPTLLIEGFPEEAARRHALDALLEAAETSGDELVATYQNFLMRFSDVGKDQSEYGAEVRRALAQCDRRVVPYLLEVYSRPVDNAFINRLGMLEDRGMDALDAWDMPPPAALEAVPGYDTAHLAWVLANGYTPTGQELLFGAVDGVFTAVDIVTLSGSAILRKPLQGVGKEIIEEGADRVVKEIAEKRLRDRLDDLARSLGKVVRKAPSEIGTMGDNIASNAVRASRSAEAYNLALRACKLAATEWTVGFGAIEVLPRSVEVAVEADKSGWVAEKTLEVLKYMQESP